jgi:Cu2+-exporting ATPase
MLLSEMIQHWLNIQIRFTGSRYVLLILSSIVFFYGGWPFLKGWLDEMKIWKPGMMTLIGFAISVAYIYSVTTVFGLTGMDFFWELATLILIMLLGHWIEMKSIAGASRELELLVQLMPSDAAWEISSFGSFTGLAQELIATHTITIKKNIFETNFMCLVNE